MTIRIAYAPFIVIANLKRKQSLSSVSNPYIYNSSILIYIASSLLAQTGVAVDGKGGQHIEQIDGDKDADKHQAVDINDIGRKAHHLHQRGAD